MTAQQALARAAQRLERAVEAPQLDAEHLMAQALGTSRAQLLARLDVPMTADCLDAFEASIERRMHGEPLAYILGEWEFWSLPLRVNPAVLIPRPETELLVEWALSLLRGKTSPVIADLGTGSGAIALALARECAEARVTGVDVSADALAVARDNAQRLGLTRAEWLHADFAQALSMLQGYDLIVSNPPYVAAGDPHLHTLTREPALALVAGADGLDCLRTIIAQAMPALAPQGWLLVEHGYDQGAAARDLFGAAGYAHIETRRDLSGQERATAGCRA